MRDGGTIVYVDYDDERIEAEYVPAEKTVLIVGGKLEGWLYNSPSGAASTGCGHYRPDVDPNRNGYVVERAGHRGHAPKRPLTVSVAGTPR